MVHEQVFRLWKVIIDNSLDLWREQFTTRLRVAFRYWKASLYLPAEIGFVLGSSQFWEACVMELYYEPNSATFQIAFFLFVVYYYYDDSVLFLFSNLATFCSRYHVWYSECVQLF